MDGKKEDDDSEEDKGNRKMRYNEINREKGKRALNESG